MSWDIYIGNAAITKNEHDGEYILFVETIEHPNAPSWPGPDLSGKSNHRAPSYSGFASFCDVTGIKVGAFTEARGSDGDCFVLTREDLASVTAARERWEKAHPGAVPGWGEHDDFNLAKLIWYEWWMTWALDNCENPSIQMS